MKVLMSVSNIISNCENSSCHYAEVNLFFFLNMLQMFVSHTFLY